jgi:RNA polymerase sigma-70 factor (ECF subfamily)
MKVFANLEQYSGKAPLEHWVSRIAVNTCIKALRAEKVRPELRWADLPEEEAQVLDWLASTDDDLRPDRNVASRELVEKLLGQLKPKDRLVISLMNLEGRTIEEVREITGWSVPVIKVRAFRARGKLRKLYQSIMREEKI